MILRTRNNVIVHKANILSYIWELATGERLVGGSLFPIFSSKKCLGIVADGAIIIIIRSNIIHPLLNTSDGTSTLVNTNIPNQFGQECFQQ